MGDTTREGFGERHGLWWDIKCCHAILGVASKMQTIPECYVIHSFFQFFLSVFSHHAFFLSCFLLSTLYFVPSFPIRYLTLLLLLLAAPPNQRTPPISQRPHQPLSSTASQTDISFLAFLPYSLQPFHASSLTCNYSCLTYITRPQVFLLVLGSSP